MKFKSSKIFKKVGVLALSMGLLLGMTNPQANAELGEYTKVSAPDTDGKIAPDLLPRGANMDEVVEVIVQFQGKPVLQEYNEEEEQGRKLSKESQKAHAENLKKEKQRAEDEVEEDDGKVISSFEKIYNGLYIQAKRSTLSKLAGLNEVQKIHAVNPVELHNDTSVPFIGAPSVWEKVMDGVNVTGEGITVAVIDTGIDYTHAAFGGAGTKEAYDANNPNVIEEGSFPTVKVVGGYDFVGTNYDAGSEDPDMRVPHPDTDPLDEQGHGTHVAATVAGLEVEGKIGKGVAPDALLYAYKVFGKSGSTAVTTQALEMAADPNGDGDVSDHVDVVNMSLGSPYGHPDDPTAVATNLAVDAGIIVVASAGNSGDIPYITGSPGVAEKAISVAASVDDGIVVGALNVNEPSSIAGQYEAVEGAITTPLSETGPITDDVVYVGRGCNGDAYLGDPSDQIALIDRGACAFSEKLTNALNAGAVAAVVANNVSSDPITMGGSAVDIPGVMISKADGTLMKNALSAGDTVNITLSDSLRIPKPWLADTIAGFSSKGPGRAINGFKPEISAPGFDINSADFGTGSEGTLKSGTSMAAPHIAGVAALLRQLHPDWNSEEIKSLIMNTSTPIQDLNDEVYPLSRQGAGRVQADVAANVTTVAYPQAIALGYVPVSKKVGVQKYKDLVVTNKGDSSKEYNVSWENRHGETTGPVSLSLPKKIKLNPGKDKKLKVKFSIDSSALSNEPGLHEFDGYVVLTEKKSGEVLRIPYQAIIEKVSDVEADTTKNAVELENDGATESITDLFIFGDEDREEASVQDQYDLRGVGARIVDDEVAEVVVTTEDPWDTPNLVEFNVYIDNNMDGQPEYIVYNQDYYAFFGLDPIGRQLTAVYDVATGESEAMYFVNVGGSWNDGFMGLPFPKSLASENGELQYQVASWGGDAEIPDMNDGGWISLNVQNPTMSFDQNTVNVPADEELEVGLTLNEEYGSVLVINNSDATKSPYTILEYMKNKKGDAVGKDNDDDEDDDDDEEDDD